MRQLTIEWRHFDEEGRTCDRCSSTGEAIHKTISRLNSGLDTFDTRVRFIETRLPARDIAQSNMVLLNGMPLEDLLPGATASENHCESCSCLMGSRTSCRTVKRGGLEFEAIPEELIHEAALKALEIQDGYAGPRRPEADIPASGR